MVDMTCCSDVHKQFDKFADGKVQVGELPKWMHVSGKVAWKVFQGPYNELGSKGFSVSGRDMGKQNWRWMSPCARDSSGVYARNMSFRHTHNRVRLPKLGISFKRHRKASRTTYFKYLAKPIMFAGKDCS
jgi:hypothetical protein